MKLAILLTCSFLLNAARCATVMEQAPPGVARTNNPFEGDEQALQAGAKLYARECSACHGTRGEGRRHAPALDRADVRDASPGVLFWVLRNGSLHKGMPSFAHLPAAQRWQIVTFLKGGLR